LYKETIANNVDTVTVANNVNNFYAVWMCVCRDIYAETCRV